MASLDNSPPGRILYISYDGILEPIGRSQVLLYLKSLAALKRVRLVSFEKSIDLRNDSLLRGCSAECTAAGIQWVCLEYNGRASPWALASNLTKGICIAFFHSIFWRPHIIHARSYIPALMAWLISKVTGTRFLFDMRGFWPQQRFDSGAWRHGSVGYRIALWLEKRFFLDADAVVSLTHAGVKRIKSFPYMRNATQQFFVIPTCTDQTLFCPAAQTRKPGTGSFTVGFVGSLSVSYHLDSMLAAFREIKSLRPDARLLIVNRDDHAMIRDALAQHAIGESDFTLKSVPHAEVAAEMRLMDVAVFFLKTFPSFAGVSPTKFGEFLSCGVPILANRGIGDFDSILQSNGVGVTIDNLSPLAIAQGARAIVTLASQPEIAERCVRTAKAELSLEMGIQAYARVYNSLLASN